jgi:hypothetical protein
MFKEILENIIIPFIIGVCTNVTVDLISFYVQESFKKRNKKKCK